MKLDNRTKNLIAVGAAISANCQPCLQTTTALALEIGINEQEIAEAIEIGKRVRKGAASKMDQYIADLVGAVPSPANAVSDGCDCGC